MTTSALLTALKDFELRSKTLRRQVNAENVSQIAKKSLRAAAEKLGSEWFSAIEPELRLANIDPALLLTYSENFEKLVKLSGPSNLRSSYLTVLKDVTRKFR